MKTAQFQFYKNEWTETVQTKNINPNLVLIFGDKESIKCNNTIAYLTAKFPDANMVYASTAGEITGNDVFSNSVCATAIEFEKTPIKCIETSIYNHGNSFDAGVFLMNQLNETPELKAVFVISDGTIVNGTELVQGLNSKKPDNVLISGGLAADDANFNDTAVGLNKEAAIGNIIVIGFYGNNVAISCSSLGGWDEFGKERTITKSHKNVLFEIDNKNALLLYKEYLGPFASELPGSALLFPLSVSNIHDDEKVVRTILSINEEESTMTFAGNVPEGSKVRFMKANFDKLINASKLAAEHTLNNNSKPALAILISCVGRKLILRERTSEEVAIAKTVFNNDVIFTGFYSYGEIAPSYEFNKCNLHNQTMTITTICEE